MKKGILYGISVGPGDPELMTMKALRILKACPVWAMPRTSGDDTVALDIVRQVVPAEGKEILPLDFVMTRDPAALEQQHQRLAALLQEALDAGRDTAVVNLGDVSIYSTFSYLAQLLAPKGYEVSWVPGVPSFWAAACALGVSLTEAKKPLHIFPGSYDIAKALSSEGGKVLMKSGKQLPQVLDAIAQAGLREKAAMVSNCGMENQKLCPNLEEAQGTEGYFTTILVRP